MIAMIAWRLQPSKMAPRKLMQADKVYFFFFIVFQAMMNSAVLNVLEETSAATSRSTFFTSRENTRLKGYIVKWAYSPSLISCSQLCARHSWCSSTNFKEASNTYGKGTCELNKHERSVMNEEAKFQRQQGVIFSLHLKGCFLTGCSNGGSCLFNEPTKNFTCQVKQPKTACSESIALGMQDGSVPDSMITASSTHANSRTAWGRLYCSLGSWTPVAETVNEWFQVNFGPEVKLISRIATQGNGGSWWWVTTYYVMYKAAGATIQEYKENDLRVTFQGNVNKDDVVTNDINKPFQSDTVRIHPTGWTGRIALRIELFGCDIY